MDLELRTSTGIQKIRVYNIYNPSPRALNDASGISTLPALAEDMDVYPSDHTIILGDLNLHHPRWGGYFELTQHTCADKLTELTDKHGFQLLTEPGTVTFSARRARTTVDLAFATEDLAAMVVQCRIAEEIDHDSDHLPTEINIALEMTHEVSTPQRAWRKLDEESLIKHLQVSRVFPETIHCKP